MRLAVGNVADQFFVTDVFREPSYRRLWASGLCLSIARWMDLVTLGWLSFQLTGSPFMVGLAALSLNRALDIRD